MKNRFSSRPTRVWLAVLATLAMMTTALVSPAAAKPNKPNPPGQPDPPGQLIDLQLLGFNDYHGHLEANTPGSIEEFVVVASYQPVAASTSLRSSMNCVRVTSTALRSQPAISSVAHRPSPDSSTTSRRLSR